MTALVAGEIEHPKASFSVHQTTRKKLFLAKMAEKKSTENGRVEQAQYRVESNKAPSLVYVKNFNLTITMTIPQLLKIFSILSMVPQFSQNITAV